MEFEEVLARRRACRRFSDRPVPAELLRAIATAALGASTASNVPYRHVMIVDDRRVIASVRQISPAMQADPPALVVILTDRKMAVERVGRIGEACALIDSGAAGENAWLAAVDAGLATGFTMISAMAGIREILGVPANVHVDLIMPVGYPATSGATSPARRRTSGIHRNQFGHVDN